MGLAGGVGGLKLVGQCVVLLAGGQVIKLLPKVKQRTGDRRIQSQTHTHKYTLCHNSVTSVVLNSKTARIHILCFHRCVLKELHKGLFTYIKGTVTVSICICKKGA